VSHDVPPQLRIVGGFARDFDCWASWIVPGKRGNRKVEIGQILNDVRLRPTNRALERRQGHEGQTSLWTDLNLNLAAAKLAVIKCD
jgi:hypothetical protein